MHLVETANKGTEKDTDAETAVWQISGITWKLDEEQSDLPEFHGGISEKDYFEEFDENGEPVETSTKTWAGYAEANQEYNGRVYVYRAVMPEELGKFEVADTADLPEIYVLAVFRQRFIRRFHLNLQCIRQDDIAFFRAKREILHRNCLI